MSSHISINDSGVFINEYVTKYAMNRLSKILIQNDMSLHQFYQYFCASGPGVFIDGMSVEKGYKVWADGWTIDQNGETRRQYGIYISAIDNNIYNPELPQNAQYWHRFTLQDIREYNVKVFEIIREYLTRHINQYHRSVQFSDDEKLNRTLTNIFKYEYFTQEIQLNRFTRYRLPGGKSLLVYGQSLPGSGFQNLSRSDVVIGAPAQHVNTMQSEAAYTQESQQKDTAQLLDVNWRFMRVTFPFDSSYASADYHVMATAFATQGEAKPFVYDQKKNEFSLAVRISDSSASVSQLYIHCVGES